MIEDLPAYGDHHTNHMVIKDGKVFFGQVTVTILNGRNYTSLNPLKPIETVVTGPYLPLGTPAQPGQVIPGSLKSNGVIYRCNPDGTELEVMAWGLRNPYGLALDSGSARIFILDQGADGRGVRPAMAPDALYELRENGWYGWPDYLAGKPITEYGDDLAFVLQEHPGRELPLHLFESHSSSVTLDISTSDAFGFRGQAFVAQYGTESPFTTAGKPVTAGRKVVRLDLDTMTEYPFFESTTVAGIGKGPNRPVMAKFSPDGSTLYILDHGVRTIPKSGGIWRLHRE